jgi:uncharacterized OsmC-like protein
VAHYCQRTGIDATDMTVDVTFDKLENPTRLANLKVRIDLPQGECADRQAAIHRVAEHCPVHETITTMQAIEIEIFDRAAHELVLA